MMDAGMTRGKLLTMIEAAPEGSRELDAAIAVVTKIDLPLVVCAAILKAGPADG